MRIPFFFDMMLHPWVIRSWCFQAM